MFLYFPALAASIWRLIGPGRTALRRLKKIKTASAYFRGGFQKQKGLTMSEVLENSENSSPHQLTLLPEDSHAKTCPLPEKGRVLLETGADYGSNLRELLTNLNQNGWSSKTYPAFYPHGQEFSRQVIYKKDKNGKVKKRVISQSSFAGWLTGGIAWRGGFLTLNISEFHSDAVESSLLQVLEADVAQKYFLSPLACRGILYRAERRGKKLPIHLERILRIVAIKGTEE